MISDLTPDDIKWLEILADPHINCPDHIACADCIAFRFNPSQRGVSCCIQAQMLLKKHQDYIDNLLLDR